MGNVVDRVEEAVLICVRKLVLVPVWLLVPVLVENHVTNLQNSIRWK